MAFTESGTLVDAGFESGTDGADLGSGWTNSGTPQKREFDNGQAKFGTLSAWIKGPTTTANAGAYNTATGGMTANGAELRFWTYFDSVTSTQRLLDDYAAGVAAADRAFYMAFGNIAASSAKMYVQTDRTGNPNGYTTGAFTEVGTDAVTTGWTQWRIVLDFSGQTYTLSKRSNLGDSWTQLKASGATGYAIPMRGTNTITQSHGTLWRGYQNSQLWLDNLKYANGGITDVDATVTPDDLTGAPVLDSPTLTAHSTVAPADLTSAPSLTSPVLTQWVRLATASGSTYTDTTGVSGTTYHYRVGEGATWLVSDPIVYPTVVQPADLTGAPSFDSLTVTAIGSVAPAGLTLASSLGEPALTAHSTVATDDLTGALALDSPTLTAHGTVTPDDLTGASSLDSPTLATSGGVSPDALTFAMVIDSPEITPQGSVVSVDDLFFAIVVGSPALVGYGSLTPGDIEFGMLIDALVWAGDMSWTKHPVLPPKDWAKTPPPVKPWTKVTTGRWGS